MRKLEIGDDQTWKVETGKMKIVNETRKWCNRTKMSQVSNTYPGESSSPAAAHVSTREPQIVQLLGDANLFDRVDYGQLTYASCGGPFRAFG